MSDTVPQAPIGTVVPLDALTHADLPLAGGKGANLGELARAGFAVPTGFVITTAGYRGYLQAHDLVEPLRHLAATGASEKTAGEIRSLFDLPLPPELAAAIRTAYAALPGSGEEPVGVAVRSSATAEDLPEASFAGQQDSFLGVVGGDALLHAVRRCWASLWTERAMAYRAEHGVDEEDVALAVVVQVMVPADAAGVMFTAHPATGRRDQVVISAAWGLGESIVGGRVDTDTIVVTDGRITEEQVADKAVMTIPDITGSIEVATPAAQRSRPVLTGAEAVSLAEVGSAIQAHFGRPQDIEWARAQGRFLIVQSRPITTLVDPVGPVPEEWPVPDEKALYFRASIVEQLPDPLSPLFADMAEVVVPRSLLSLFAEIGTELGKGPLLDGGIQFITINGYAFYLYTREALWQFIKITPSALKMAFGRKAGDTFERRWRKKSLPAYRECVNAWAGRDPSTMPAGDLVAGVLELLAAGCVYYTTVQTLIPTAATGELAWTAFYDRLAKRGGDPSAVSFLLGFESEPIRAEKNLFDLASWCREQAGLVEALATDPLDEAPPGGIAADVWTEWKECLGNHLARFGHTTYNLDFVQPVPADDPGPVLDTLRFLIADPSVDPYRREQVSAATRRRQTNELFARLDPLRARLGRRLLETAQKTTPLREDALAEQGLAWPVMRRLLREVGRRLVDAGALERPMDVCWLHRAELDRLTASLDGVDVPMDPSLKHAVEERRTQWRGQRLATPPQYLPINRWMALMDDVLPARNEEQTGPMLKGTAGSGGRVTGAARVLAGAEDFGSFAAGEILVAAITTPAYTPLFARAGGVVTDIGGVLSHSSIVAREYGIPAVLGTGVATKRIRTGDRITVDGDRGMVVLDDSEPVEEPGRSRWPVVAAAGAGVAGFAWLLTRRRRRLRAAP